MTTYIFNADGKCVSQSHNLRGLFVRACIYGGVTSLDCHVFDNATVDIQISPGDTRTHSRPTGYLVAHFAGGQYAETWFSCGSHLIEWARERVKPRKNSWFSGASVNIINRGAWVNLQPGKKGATE
jgi:hypothetical protein